MNSLTVSKCYAAAGGIFLAASIAYFFYSETVPEEQKAEGPEVIQQTKAKADFHTKELPFNVRRILDCELGTVCYTTELGGISCRGGSHHRFIELCDM